MPVSSARATAFDILMRVETTDAYASELLHSSRAAKLSPGDHGLATEIVMGVLRWRSVLDEHVSAHLDKPLAKLDAEVITALRVGAYQLLFLDRIPAHAATHESVELVKKAKKRSAAGMVNAVLRKICSHSLDPSSLDSGGRSASEPSSVARDDNSIKAHPTWLVHAWERIYGTEAVHAICGYDQTTPRTVIRAAAALAQELATEGVRLEPGNLLKSAHQVTHGDITMTRAFRERRLSIQDEGSQLVALLLGRGNRILDCCAAPGGKTRIVAEENPNSTVIATELHPHRAALMRRLVPLPNVHVIAADIRTMPFAAQFDRILVDAPCTGTGTLARNPEIKWRVTSCDITRMQAYQIEILSAAMKQLAPGGRLLYSTCSLEPEENEAVIEHALRDNHSLRRVEMRHRLAELHNQGALVCDPDFLVRGTYVRTIPGVDPCDGFFAVLLERQM